MLSVSNIFFSEAFNIHISCLGLISCPSFASTGLLRRSLQYTFIGNRTLLKSRGPRDQYTVHRVRGVGGVREGLMKFLEGQKNKFHAVDPGPKISPDMLYEVLDLL
jgi:hypothetical protein